jgi:hypothetical protein
VAGETALADGTFEIDLGIPQEGGAWFYRAVGE